MPGPMTKMFKIALPDGSVKEMPEGSTPADVAAAIGRGSPRPRLPRGSTARSATSCDLSKATPAWR